jgi:hypothetical protein
MPRGGAVTLADVPEPTIEISCEPCGRRGRYAGERLIAAHGADVRLPDLLATLADCPRARSVSIHGGFPGRFFGYHALPSECGSAPT